MRKRSWILFAAMACLIAWQMRVPANASQPTLSHVSVLPQPSSTYLLRTPAAVPLPALHANHDAPPKTWVTFTARARQVYQQSLRSGHDPHLFTLAGDSNSNPLSYLDRITAGAFDLTKYPNLRTVVTRYKPSFAHISLAVGGGFR